ncbi:MAG: hypothetical protein ACRELY_22265 [Polyangiaceae bacterium]
MRLRGLVGAGLVLFAATSWLACGTDSFTGGDDGDSVSAAKASLATQTTRATKDSRARATYAFD